MYEGLYDSGALYFATHLFVLVDEATQRGVLVANLPPLVNDDCHEHQHHNYHGGGEGYGEDNAYFHTLCDFDRKGTARRGNNSLTVGKESPISRKCGFLAVSKREKSVWSETTRHLFIDGMGIFYFFATLTYGRSRSRSEKFEQVRLFSHLLATLR